MCGGGRIPTPGEISLAHLGVLFLDELTEYPRPVLECLRQPMEDASIQISRVSGTFVYPADFMLVAAMNPCPCGYYPDRGKCTCSPGEIRRHLEHISQPLLDRMDICVEMPRGGYAEVKVAHTVQESSVRIRDRVIRAVLRQRERFAGTGIRTTREFRRRGWRNSAPSAKSRNGGWSSCSDVWSECPVVPQDSEGRPDTGRSGGLRRYTGKAFG